MSLLSWSQFGVMWIGSRCFLFVYLFPFKFETWPEIESVNTAWVLFRPLQYHYLYTFTHTAADTLQFQSSLSSSFGYCSNIWISDHFWMSVLFCVRKLQSNKSELEPTSEKEKTKERILIMVILSRVPFACVIWHFLPARAAAQRIYTIYNTPFL